MLNMADLLAGAETATARHERKRQKGSRPFFTIDCETTPFRRGRIPVPFVWCLFTGQEYMVEWNEYPEKIMSYIAECDCVVYAHNGGKFDYHYLTQFFSPGRVVIVSGRLASFRVGNAELRDSYMLFPAALSKYKKDDFDYSVLEPDRRKDHRTDIETYIKNDCRYLWLMLDEFFREYGREFTQASAAMKMLRRLCAVDPPRTNPKFYQRYRPYYYGGRVQCFEHGDIRGDFVSADINSAYPYAMIHSHPFGASNRQLVGVDPERYVDAAQMFWTLDAESFGAFPYKVGQSTYYPDARVDNRRVRTYSVTGWELVAAMETGTAIIHRVHHAFRFDECRDFREYVHHFWSLKNGSEKGSGRYWFAKIFLNALYGKFAANPERYKDYWFTYDIDEFYKCLATPRENRNGRLVLPYGAGFLIQKPLAEDKRRYYNVATGASITGFVRAYLWRHIWNAERPLYCDTDSITAKSFSNMRLENELGAWEIEGEYDRCIIGGKKLYAMHLQNGSGEHAKEYWHGHNWKIASKGVRATAQDIADVCGGKTVTLEPEVPTYSIRPRMVRGQQQQHIFFMPRDIMQTGQDIRVVPGGY